MDLNLPRWWPITWLHVGAKERDRRVTGRSVSTGAQYTVAVCPGLRACEHITAFTNVRYPAGEAPRLPLPGCSSRRCTCKYVHHADRRRSARRSSASGLARDPWSGAERRKSPGRRATDRMRPD